MCKIHTRNWRAEFKPARLTLDLVFHLFPRDAERIQKINDVILISVKKRVVASFVLKP